MATQILPVVGSATPYSKKFTLLGDTGVEGIFSINDFATYLDDGPLRQTLLGASPLAVDQFNVDQARGSEIRIYEDINTPAGAPSPRAGARKIKWIAGANAAAAGLSCTATTGNVLAIEIRLNHTTQA
jgi:hypothetical protein